MVQANFQLPVIKKQDTPALTPSPIALSDLPMIKRAQAKMAPMLLTTCTIPKLRQEIPTVLTYRDLKDAKMITHLTSTAQGKAKTPRELPVLPQPPKPLDYKREKQQQECSN